MVNQSAPADLRSSADPQPPADPRPPADLRLLTPAIGTWLAALAGLRLPLRPVMVITAVLVVGAVVLLRVTVGDRATVVAAALVCVAAGLIAAGLRADSRRHGTVADLARGTAAVRVRLAITGDPQPHPGRTNGSMRRADVLLVSARVEEITAAGRTQHVRAPLLVLAQDPAWRSLLPSQHLSAEGRLAPSRGTDPVAAVLSARGPPQQVGAPSTVQRAAGRLRAGLRTATDGLPADERGLLPGLVDGDVSRLPPELADDFRTTGLTHLVAVSGSNVAIVLAAALVVGRRLRLGVRLAPAAAGLALLGFVMLARPQPSVLRAAVMGGIAVVALASGRRRAALPALCAAVVVLILVDPDLAAAGGFALSVLATLGLLVLAPGWRDRLAKHLPDWFAEALAVPAAAQLACGPVIAALAGSVSLVAVPANLLAVPAVASATVLGVLTAALAPVAMPLARLLAWLAFVPVWWLVRVAHTGAEVPGGSIGWPAGVGGAALLLLATGALAAILAAPRLRRLVAAVTAGALVAVVCLRVAAPTWPPPGWRLVACDVGQGDAVVLSARGDSAVVVDVGPDPRLVDGCLRGLGVRRVPLVLLTHLHADHVEGLPGVLRHRTVALIQTGPLDEPASELARVRGWADAAGVPLARAAVGTDNGIGSLSWRVIAPTRPYVGTSSDPNNSSVVVQVSTGGVTALLTGDVEPPAQRALQDSGIPLHADVLKVPHHGSDAQEPAFLRQVGAAVSLTSVGVDNPYHHPAPGTLGQLSAAGVRSYRTDSDGAVAVTGSADGVRVVARRGVGVAPAGTAMRRGAREDAGPAASGSAVAGGWMATTGKRRGLLPTGIVGCWRRTMSVEARPDGSRARAPPSSSATMPVMSTPRPSQPPPALTLIVGTEELLVSRAVAAALAAVRAVEADTDVDDVAVAGLQPGDLATLLSPSLFGNCRVVVLRGLEDADLALAAALNSYLAAPVDEVAVVAVHSGGTKGRRVLDAVAAKATVRVDCQAPRTASQRRDFVATEVRRAGGRIDSEAADQLLQAVGSDLRALATAAEQLVADTAGRVDADAIRRYHRGRPETTGFAVADRAMVGDAAGALELFRWGQSVNVAPVLFTSGLAAALRSVVQVAPYLRERPSDLARRLGWPSWRAEKAQRQARAWHPEGIATAILAVAAADAEVKGGAADAAYAVERMLLAAVAAQQQR